MMTIIALLHNYGLHILIIIMPTALMVVGMAQALLIKQIEHMIDLIAIKVPIVMDIDSA